VPIGVVAELVDHWSGDASLCFDFPNGAMNKAAKKTAERAIQTHTGNKEKKRAYIQALPPRGQVALSPSDVLTAFCVGPSVVVSATIPSSGRENEAYQSFATRHLFCYDFAMFVDEASKVKLTVVRTLPACCSLRAKKDARIGAE
jgi:hypothetical protein